MAEGGKKSWISRETMNQELRLKWEEEQERLKTRIVLTNTEDWQRELSEGLDSVSGLKYVAGVDLSFIKGDDVNACVGFVVLNYPQLEVVYEDCQMVEMTEPYIPGFLAFREAPALISAYEKLVQTKPELTPQVLMVDGNGIIHPKGFGLGCHLGLQLDVPALGVAKNLFHVDGLENSPQHKADIREKLLAAGDWFPLVGASGATLGAAVRGTDESTKPVYVSVGHRLSLDVAVHLVSSCCRKRVPEPTRQADLRSREYLRKLEE